VHSGEGIKSTYSPERRKKRHECKEDTMQQNELPNEQPKTPQTNPVKKGEDQNAQPNRPEINPAKPANDTEVDLDTNKTKTYPGNNPPERH